jgi:hypothetical protein
MKIASNESKGTVKSILRVAGNNKGPEFSIIRAIYCSYLLKICTHFFPSKLENSVIIFDDFHYVQPISVVFGNTTLGYFLLRSLCNWGQEKLLLIMKLRTTRTTLSRVVYCNASTQFQDTYKGWYSTVCTLRISSLHSSSSLDSTLQTAMLAFKKAIGLGSKQPVRIYKLCSAVTDGRQSW